MADLDLTNVRDFATFLALMANKQGQNGEVALEKWNIKNSTWKQYCKSKEVTQKGN